MHVSVCIRALQCAVDLIDVLCEVCVVSSVVCVWCPTCNVRCVCGGPTRSVRCVWWTYKQCGVCVEGPMRGVKYVVDLRVV